MYKFKYIQRDNTIYINGEYYSTYDEFMAENPNFPLVQGRFFEYRGNGILELINSEGHHAPQGDLTEFQSLITAIENLGN